MKSKNKKPTKARRAKRLVCDGLVQPSEGLHQLWTGTERYVVDVRDTMQDQWPCTREVRMAFFLSGPTRFPWSVRELLDMGATFKAIR